ncbi:MAG: elongation factor Ts [Chloroflexales bacterium]|nr:elongation factor Ts [Chloroflexales bacterium]
MVKELRDRTGAGFKDAKEILTATGGDMNKAIEELKQRGMADAGKKAGREASEGRIEVYIHAGNRMGALVELNCETDFVARTEAFIALSKELAIHIAATKPRYIRPEEVPADEVAASGLSAEKYYEENVLLAQPFVRTPSETIGEKVQAAIARLGENIVVRRFVRYEIGA